jgi:hypothetical protein
LNSRDKTCFDSWLPVVQRMRPAQLRGDVVRVLNQKPGISCTV